MNYFQISMPEVWACQYSPQWIRKLQSDNVLCSICSRVLPGWFPAPIDVVANTVSYPIRPSHRIVPSQTGIALLDRKLLEQLLQWLPPVAIGRVTDMSGQVVDSHVSIYPERAVDPRGSTYRYTDVCAECGTVRVYPASTDPSYFVEYQVEGRACVLDRVGMIYVDAVVAEQLDLSGLRPAYLDSIQVLSRPQDGLRFPGDPSWVTGKDATVPIPE